MAVKESLATLTKYVGAATGHGSLPRHDGVGRVAELKVKEEEEEEEEKRQAEFRRAKEELKKCLKKKKIMQEQQP